MVHNPGSQNPHSIAPVGAERNVINLKKFIVKLGVLRLDAALNRQIRSENQSAQPARDLRRDQSLEDGSPVVNRQ